ncbi:hypothetical protein KKG77_00435 [bacterium]|nr:hypothetical protein [bacterium]
MNLSYLTSLFKKKSKTLQPFESSILQKLKSVVEENGLYLYQDITIYHHTHSFFIPLLLLDPQRGLYLFESKSWNYDELKNAKVQKASKQDSTDKSLAFEHSHEIIRQRFNELTHNDGAPIFNYLLMENLSSDEYQTLDISFQELLPKSKVLFSDSSSLEIIQKLQEEIAQTPKLPTAANIIGSILVQYCVLDKNSLHLCTREQMRFIDTELPAFSVLDATHSSGKTNVLALKAILEKLKNPSKRIIIIKETNLACEILKKKLLDIIEHAIVEADITSIEVITPIDLINKHLDKLKKIRRIDTLYIEEALFKKSLDAADLIMCDDADFYNNDFISYLKHIQKKAALLLVSSKEATKDFTFTQNFRSAKQEAHFHKTNPHAKTLQILSELLQTHKAKDILVVSNSLSQEKLNDDLKFFIRDKAVLLDSSKNLVEIDLNSLLLTTYANIDALSPKFILLLDVPFVEEAKLNYAFNLAEKFVYVLYEDECEVINNLRSQYESTKE